MYFRLLITAVSFVTAVLEYSNRVNFRTFRLFSGRAFIGGYFYIDGGMLFGDFYIKYLSCNVSISPHLNRFYRSTLRRLEINDNIYGQLICGDVTRRVNGFQFRNISDLAYGRFRFQFYLTISFDHFNLYLFGSFLNFNFYIITGLVDLNFHFICGFEYF